MNKNQYNKLARDFISEQYIDFDTITKKFFWDGKELDPEDLKVEVRRNFEGFLPSQRLIDSVLHEFKEVFSFNAVEEYLESLPKPKDFDKLNFFFQDLFGNKPSELESILGRKWFISAVARALEPGCPVEGVLILKGEQGTGKSRFFRELVPDDALFTDAWINISNPKEIALIYSSSWIVEFGIERLLRKKPHTQEHFLDTTKDNYKDISLPRNFILCGTTNKDITSKNRRHWVVKINQLNFDKYTPEYRDELWSQAYAAYQQCSSPADWHLSAEERSLLINNK